MKKLLVILFLAPYLLFCQQMADTSFKYETDAPLFATDQGLVVAIDEGHNNFHTLEGRYGPFGQVLRAEGFRMDKLSGVITTEKLEGIDILVISNPIHPSNVGNWILPNPSAYSKAEIETLNEWVNSGGKLFLIADHMPFGGAAGELAKSFGFEFTNGFARFPTQNGWDQFNKDQGSLISNSLTSDLNKVLTFTGQAFQKPEAAQGILKFPNGSFSLEPDTAWRFNADTFRRDISDWYQGAVLEYGEGRLVVFGEAAMFTTQIAGQNRTKVGMNTNGAEDNARLLRNIMAWLAGKD